MLNSKEISMKQELNEEIVKIPVELAKKIQVAIEMTPGLDFNSLLIQALNQWFSGKYDSQQKLSLADLKERFIEDSSLGHGPRATVK